MKKLSLSLICTISFVQHTQSMELATPFSNEDGYPIEIKEGYRPFTPISKQYDALSEQLYKKDITDTEIGDLVSKGAKINYQGRSSAPIPIYYAFNATEQGIKNMKTIINLGAEIHSLENEEHTPLTIATQNNSTDMLLLLLSYETPVVTIYKYKNKQGSETTYTIEKRIREYLIDNAFGEQNYPVIELLLKLELVNANHGLKKFVYYRKPNQKILNLLLKYRPTNMSNILPQSIGYAFPSNEYINCFKQICTSKTSNKEVLEKMRTIQNEVNEIVSLLESCDK